MIMITKMYNYNIYSNIYFLHYNELLINAKLLVKFAISTGIISAVVVAAATPTAVLFNASLCCSVAAVSLRVCQHKCRVRCELNMNDLSHLWQEYGRDPE